ncbi:MAG: ATP-binding protein [Parcubacteria group bacterium]|nr:ATP-binding protein [Parcubacteria group bacterium]
MQLKNVQQILLDQKDDLESIFKEKKIIERDVWGNYNKLLKSSLVKVITGPRRAGKSVLSFQLLRKQNFGYVNFDDERLSILKPQDLNLLLEAIYTTTDKKPKFIFFDEIQNAPKWELFINRLNRQGFNIIVTGSNAELLNTELSNRLTGRHFALELYPFSFREYLRFNSFEYRKDAFSTKETASLHKYLEKYLFYGGFPEVIQGEDYKRYLVALYSNILTRDIILRHKIKHINTFKEVANYLISNFSCKITFNKLKNIFSLKSVHTAKNYFSFLEESYLIFAINRFSYKQKERIIAPRKTYTIDTGLINAFSIKFSQDIGHIYENAVALEILRKKALDPMLEVYYWEDTYHHEVDFVIKQGAKVKELIQVSYNISKYDTKKRELSSLLKASHELKCNNLLVITADYEKEEKIKGKKIKFIPLWKWLLKEV